MVSKVSKRILILVLAFALGCLLIGCASTTGKLKSIQESGEMVVYTDANFSPFEFQAPGGGVMGVDIEIAKAIAQRLGVTAKFEDAKFDSILMAIKGGKGDIAISGFTITEERRESVDFSVPYIESVQYLILPSDSGIRIMEDLAGKRVAVAFGYTGEFLMDDETGEEGVLFGTGTEVTAYNSASEATMALNSGKVDAVVMDEYVAKNIVSNNSSLQAIALSYQSGDLASEEYGVAVPKGNEDLLAIINEVIASLKSEGKIQEWVVSFSA